MERSLTFQLVKEDVRGKGAPPEGLVRSRRGEERSGLGGAFKLKA